MAHRTRRGAPRSHMAHRASPRGASRSHMAHRDLTWRIEADLADDPPPAMSASMRQEQTQCAKWTAQRATEEALPGQIDGGGKGPTKGVPEHAFRPPHPDRPLRQPALDIPQTRGLKGVDERRAGPRIPPAPLRPPHSATGGRPPAAPSTSSRPGATPRRPGATPRRPTGRRRTQQQPPRRNNPRGPTKPRRTHQHPPRRNPTRCTRQHHPQGVVRPRGSTGPAPSGGTSSATGCSGASA